MATETLPVATRLRPRRRIDLLTWPLLGRFFKWRHARVAMQVPVFLLAGLMIFDGLVGPSLAPKNLATVGAWLQYRGLVVLALLVAGNLFCMACPFMLPRRAGHWLGGRLWGGGHQVPRPLRSKWLAVALTVVFFYAYERYSLWASPWLTAWVALGYFLAAFVVDTWFQGAAFCKYVCPLGQFNFFGSLMSPLEVKVREPDTCSACHTKDCITGRLAQGSALGTGLTTAKAQPSGLVDVPSPMRVLPRPALQEGLNGCELWLFQERKAGNMDCTFCLDCIHACPHDNIGMIGRLPTRELWSDPYHSGVGRFSRRRDLAALVIVLTFAGFVNAFNMIRPVYVLRDRLVAALGLNSPTPVLILTFILGLLVLPALLVGGAGWLSRRLGRQPGSVVAVIQRYVYALVPLGFGMWLAHYGFHFMTGALTIVPVAQSFLSDVGLYAGTVSWGLGPILPGGWLFPIEAFFLYLGAAGSMIVAFQIAREEVAGSKLKVDGSPVNVQPSTFNDQRGRVLGAALPWMGLCLMLLALGLWIMLQPMDMRGTLMLPAPVGG
jgi:hypothetical protein